MNTKRITPHLWFDTEAKEAAEFYVSLFDNSKITHVSQVKGTPSGDTDIVSFELDGQSFMAISAGPVFKFNPSISFFLRYHPSRFQDAKERISAAWEKLVEGGKVLMPLQEYPFSDWYGWVQDRFGVTWQLMLPKPEAEQQPFIMPSLMFTAEKAGHAEDAINFYGSVFKDGKPRTLARYPAGMEPNKEGTLMYSDFHVHNTWLAAMDAAGEHDFTFNEAISLLVPCDTQEDVDYYWEKLSAVPAAEQCGWLKDKFGVSWQIWPTDMGIMMSEGTEEQIARVTKAFMQMKKFDLAALRAAYKG